MKDPLAGYPDIFIEIASKAYYGQPIDPLPVMDERSSYPQLHRFNRFRNVLVRERNPYAFAAKDLIARREYKDGQWYLTFSPSGLYEAKLFAAGAAAETVLQEHIRKEKGPEIDKGEEMMERYMRTGSMREKEMTADAGEDPPVPISSCEHEFLLGRCLKCGVPV